MAMFFDRGRGWLAAAALAALGLAAPARGQYAPYGSGAAQYAQPQQQYNAYAPTTAPTQQPQYAAQGAYQGYAAAQPGYTVPPTTQPGYGVPQPGYAQPQYGAFGAAAPRVAMAFNNQATTPTPSAGGENLPLTPPVEAVPAGTPQNGGYIPPTTQPAMGPALTPTPESYGAPAAGYGAGYESYPSGGAGCATGNCGTGYAAAPTAANGYGYGACDTSGAGCNTYSTYGGMGGVLGKHAGCGYWFGGAYGLLMDRDNSNKYALAFVTDPSMPTAYPPQDMNVVLTTRDADIGYQPGVEFRLGRAFGGCNPCGCGCGPMWGIEAVYWTLFEDDAMRSYDNPTGTSRTYTMMPMYGLEYSHPGTGTYLPMNEYWDHGIPSMPANTIRVDEVHTRSSFEVQNVELNLLRLNLCGGGYAGGYGGFGGGFGGGMGGGCSTGCDSGCVGGCSTGACTTGCAPCGPRYSCTAVCGVRWMQFNESFMFGVNYTDINTPTTSGYADYWATVENNLIGAQLGCNGMYRIGCKWGLHVNTLVGVYGNDINTRQYFNSTGDVRVIGTLEDFDAMANKTDVAMLGELRIGASYQATCHWRLYGGWRALGVTGIALATDQMPNAVTSAAQMNNYVNSNGSLILNGLQAGAEFCY